MVGNRRVVEHWAAATVSKISELASSFLRISAEASSITGIIDKFRRLFVAGPVLRAGGPANDRRRWRGQLVEDVVRPGAGAGALVPHPPGVGLALQAVAVVHGGVAGTRARLVVEEGGPEAVRRRHGQALACALLVLLQDQLLELLLDVLVPEHLRLELHVDLLPAALGGDAGDVANGVGRAKALASIDEHEVGLLVADEADQHLLLHAGESYLDGGAGQLARMVDLHAADDLLAHRVLAPRVADLLGQGGDLGERLLLSTRQSGEAVVASFVKVFGVDDASGALLLPEAVLVEGQKTVRPLGFVSAEEKRTTLNST